MKIKLKKNNRLFYLLLVAVVTLLFMFPVYWMINTSFMTSGEAYSATPTFIPSMILDHYKQTLDHDILLGIKNSFIIGFLSTVIGLVLAIPAAYALARSTKRWLKWTIIAFVVAQILPPVLMVTPLFVIFRSLGLLNTYLGVALANVIKILPFSVLILRPTIQNIPIQIEESALIDGASTFTVFRKIIIPLSKSGIAVTGVISFVYGYNDFVYAISLLNDMDIQPATVMMYTLLSEMSVNWNGVMAFATLTALPVIVIFVTLQRQIVSGLTSGSFK